MASQPASHWTNHTKGGERLAIAIHYTYLHISYIIYYYYHSVELVRYDEYHTFVSNRARKEINNINKIYIIFILYHMEGEFSVPTIPYSSYHNKKLSQLGHVIKKKKKFLFFFLPSFQTFLVRVE